MKVVMKSVSPRICEKVANGDCTVLVSKTAPKQVPFKCYIYCTRITEKKHCSDEFDIGMWKGNEHVIGEFVCDSAEWMSMRDCDKACMTLKEAVDYGKGKKLYSWHISDLKIYDSPLTLDDFNLKKAPSGWQYVEEL